MDGFRVCLVWSMADNILAGMVIRHFRISALAMLPLSSKLDS